MHVGLGSGNEGEEREMTCLEAIGLQSGLGEYRPHKHMHSEKLEQVRVVKKSASGVG